MRNEVPVLARVSRTAAVVLRKLCSLYNHCGSITHTNMKNTLFTNTNLASVEVRSTIIGCHYSYIHPAETNDPF